MNPILMQSFYAQFLCYSPGKPTKDEEYFIRPFKITSKSKTTSLQVFAFFRPNKFVRSNFFEKFI